MRFMLQVRANRDSEAGVMPTRKQLAEMGAFNEEMIKAGIMLAADGLHSSAKGARVSFRGGRPSIAEPPFAPPEELIAGFWIIRVGSRQEAIDWACRVPFEDGVIEIRQIFEPEDFPADILPPEAAAREAAFRRGERR